MANLINLTVRVPGNPILSRKLCANFSTSAYFYSVACIIDTDTDSFRNDGNKYAYKKEKNSEKNEDVRVLLERLVPSLEKFL